MLESILGRKNFKTRCKSALTRTRTRIEVIRRKRNAMQKFLKKDIADLLKNNLERNAYGRVEGLYMEMNLSSCYDYVEECCKCVSAHLKYMREQRECPEGCRVAVASLVYAAARFADLPELRDLRTQFTLRYGDSIAPYVSKEFVDMLTPNPPTVEMKLQVMQNVAKDFSVRWDPITLEQQLIKHSVSTNDQGASDGQNICRTKSAIVQGKDKKEDYGKQIGEDQKAYNTGFKLCHAHSCINGDFSSKLDEQNIRQDWRSSLSSIGDSEGTANRKPFTSGLVPAPSAINKAGKLRTCTKDRDSKDEQNSLQEKNSEEGSPHMAMPRPRSVRTKFSKSSLSSASSSDLDHDMDLKETFSARTWREMSISLPGDLEDEEDDMENNVWSYFGKASPRIQSPTSAKSVSNTPFSNYSLPNSPLRTPDREALNGKLASDLPLPPGRRRYFSESQPSSPCKDDNGRLKSALSLSPKKTRFLPAKLRDGEDSGSSSKRGDPFGHVHSRSD